MATGTNTVGQVLGATTAVGGGIAVLPATGHTKLGILLALTAGLIGVIVLVSFVGTRLLRKLT